MRITARSSGPEEVEDAILTAAERDDSRVAMWRYCCGICRNKLAAKMGGKGHCPTCGQEIEYGAHPPQSVKYQTR